MISFNKRTLNMEAGNKCTLQCSACARQRYRKQGKKIPGKDITPEQFRKVIKYFKRVSFCGTFSDPIFNVHFIDILKIAKEENIKVEVHTAASHKPERWWQEAFLAGGPKANWIFGIDGLPKDSHKYRVNQDGEFLFDMMLLNKYLGFNPEWQYIVFDYNKNDIEEAKKLAKQHKLRFMLITSKRPVSKEIQNVELEEVKDGQIGWKNSSKETDGYNSKTLYASIDYKTGEWTPRPMSKVEDKKNKANSLKPKCLLTNRDLSYSGTGHILPCCWVNTQFNDKYVKPLFKDTLKIENNNSVEEILDKNEWKEFMNVLENNPDDKLPFVCKKYCSVDVERNVESERKLYENYLL